jgi:hypothetical protein
VTMTSDPGSDFDRITLTTFRLRYTWSPTPAGFAAIVDLVAGPVSSPADEMLRRAVEKALVNEGLDEPLAIVGILLRHAGLGLVPGVDGRLGCLLLLGGLAWRHICDCAHWPPSGLACVEPA